MTVEPTAGPATLLVRPFEGPAGDAGQGYFVRGFVDDLIGDFARFADLRVIAAHSAQLAPADDAHCTEPHDPQASQLRADFVLSGGLRRSGAQLRISTRLSDGRDGRVLWAEHFDRAAEELFEIHDAIVARVVATVSARINAALLAAARRKPRTQLVAYEHWLQGHDCLKRGTLSADEEARRWFEAALACDPAYARAYLGLSLSYFNEWSCQLWQRWDDNERRAFEYAERARELDPDDHYAELVLGRVLLFRREFERAEQHLERSLLLNPNDADCLVQIAYAFAFLGQPERGAALFRRAVEQNPLHQAWYFAYYLGLSYCLEQYEETLATAARVPPDVMVDLSAYRAAALSRLGRDAEAAAALADYLEQFEAKIIPGREPEAGEALRWLKHVNPFKRPEDERRLVEAVVAVGSASAPRQSPVVPSATQRAFRKVGSLWQLSYDGLDAWLPDLKGLHDLRTLLERAGRDVHCTELQGSVAVTSDDERIDERAKSAYLERARELQSALDEAEQHNDLARAEQLRAELDAITEHLSSALGLGGRARKLDATVERARSAVTQRIRGAIKRVAEVHQPLGQHLGLAIQTGVFCAYRPEKPLNWEL